jgi:predicted NUDIX family NTP pyrophosphohydrolase
MGSKKQSAGLLLYRFINNQPEVLLVHPGGPFWAKKDQGAWSIPKGEFLDDEEPLVAAKREFSEELGGSAPEGGYAALGELKQPSGKIVHVWALLADFDLKNFKSGTFEMEWPPRSGKTQEFPECDKAAWLDLATAKTKLLKGQAPFLDRLAEQLAFDTRSFEPPVQASLF